VQWQQNWKLDPAKNVIVFRFLSAKLINVGRYSGRRFLGAFAKLRKTTISFVMSDSPSICTHGTTPSPNLRILIKFYIRVFFEKLSKKFKFH
jgi:hypothetical protein